MKIAVCLLNLFCVCLNVNYDVVVIIILFTEIWILGTFAPTTSPIEVPTTYPTDSPTWMVPNKKIDVRPHKKRIDFCDPMNITCDTANNLDVYKIEWVINDGDGTASLSRCDSGRDYQQFKNGLHNETLIVPQSCLADSTINSELKFECRVTARNDDRNFGYGVGNATVERRRGARFDVKFLDGRSYRAKSLVVML